MMYRVCCVARARESHYSVASSEGSFHSLSAAKQFAKLATMICLAISEYPTEVKGGAV